MLLADLADTSARVAATSSRRGKVAALGECLRRARPGEAAIATAYLAGTLPQGRIGVGWASLRELPPPAPPPPSLELAEVEAALAEVAALAGPGSQAARRETLGSLLARATEPEQRFLVALLASELRQGAL